MSGATIWRAAVNFRHFDFEAFGVDAASAAAALRAGIEAHCAQVPGADLAYMLEAADADGEPRPFTLGRCYRDRDLI